MNSGESTTVKPTDTAFSIYFVKTKDGAYKLGLEDSTDGVIYSLDFYVGGTWIVTSRDNMGTRWHPEGEMTEEHLPVLREWFGVSEDSGFPVSAWRKLSPRELFIFSVNYGSGVPPEKKSDTAGNHIHPSMWPLEWER